MDVQPKRMTFEQFQATKQETSTLLIYVYKGDMSLPDEDLAQECLFISKDGDGGHHLHIENQIYSDTALEDLERILYTWAFDEGWLDLQGT